MTLDTFFEKFELLADAPNAVARMRELILSLAVQGGLVEQHALEGSGSDLIEKSAIIVESKRTLPTIPNHWVWVQLGKIVIQMDSGWSPACDSEQAPANSWGVLKTTAVQTLAYQEWQNKTLPPNLEPRPVHEVMDGDILFTRAGPKNRVGIICVARPTRSRLMISDKIIRFHLVPGIDPDFAALALNAGHSSEVIEILKSGMADSQVNISQPKLRSVPIPVPPLAEQKRIVAKVDELMALCDRLAAQQQDRDTRQTILARAALSRFADAPTLANLGYLFHPAFAIAPGDLRKAILTLAVRGKLVGQDAKDEPITKSFPDIKILASRDPANFCLPLSWTVASYRSLTSLVTSGSRGWKDFYSDSGAIFIRTQNINTDKLVLDDVAFVQLPESAEGKRSMVLEGDILITITGANVTKAALVETQLPEAYISQHIALTRPRWSTLSKWLHLCFISPGAARGQLEKLSYGDKPGLNLNHIRDLEFPLPPLAEQQRIVAKVDQLMALVDALETQLAASRATAANLLSALVADLTSQKGGSDET